MKIFDPKKRKEVFVGSVKGDTFYRSVNSKHYMVLEGGYGMQTTLLDKLIREKVKNIRFTTQKGKTLDSTIADWVQWGKIKKYGHGRQTFLKTDFMKKGKLT